MKKKIREKLFNIFMFKGLDDADFEIVIMAMKEVQASPGKYVIKEGDQGDCLYVTESGTFDCTKTFPGNQEQTFLK